MSDKKMCHFFLIQPVPYTYCSIDFASKMHIRYFSYVNPSTTKVATTVCELDI